MFGLKFNLKKKKIKESQNKEMSKKYSTIIIFKSILLALSFYAYFLIFFKKINISTKLEFLKSIREISHIIKKYAVLIMYKSAFFILIRDLITFESLIWISMFIFLQINAQKIKTCIYPIEFMLYTSIFSTLTFILGILFTLEIFTIFKINLLFQSVFTTIKMENNFERQFLKSLCLLYLELKNL